MPYSNVTPEGLREAILHLLRNDDERLPEKDSSDLMVPQIFELP